MQWRIVLIFISVQHLKRRHILEKKPLRTKALSLTIFALFKVWIAADFARFGCQQSIFSPHFIEQTIFWGLLCEQIIFLRKNIPPPPW